jgi:hypothetical protein
MNHASSTPAAKGAKQSTPRNYFADRADQAILSLRSLVVACVFFV